jgi:alpha-ribazole phosphatase
MAESLYLVRHGSIGAAGQGRYIGSTDAPLCEEGERQAAALAERLRARTGLRRCLCSPLRRAVRTAEILGGATGLAPEIVPDLREIAFGSWEGRTFDEIRDSSPDQVERWARFAPDFAFPGGERIQDFLARVSRAAERLAAAEPEAVLAVTHAGVIRAMLCHLLDLPPRAYVAFDIAPASLTVVRLFDGKGVLSEMIR